MAHNIIHVAHPNKPPLDLDKLKPTEDYTRDDLEEFVYRLRRHGYKGKKYGSKEIYKEQVRLFKPSDNSPKLLSLATIERRINDAPNYGKNPIRYAAEGTNYSPDAVPNNWRSYVARLSMISEFLWDRPLTVGEAEAAEIVGGAFNDPFGEQVDLIPQLAMVRQYERQQYPSDFNPDQIFDVYFTYAPWKYGFDFYLKQLLEARFSKPKTAIPILTDFMLFASETEGWKEVSTVFDDALRQLCLMQFHFYWDLEKDSLANIPGGFGAEDESKGACNWIKILESKDNDRETWAEIKRVPVEASKHRQVRTEFLND